MAVDFAYKQRTRGNEGWALRNIKLRMSRKLIFIAGLLLCFSCDLQLTPKQKELIYKEHAVATLIKHLQRLASFPPLELVATALIERDSLADPIRRLFRSYDDFIGLLADESPLANGKTPRQQLHEISVDDLDSDETFSRARGISRVFQNAVH